MFSAKFRKEKKIMTKMEQKLKKGYIYTSLSRKKKRKRKEHIPRYQKSLGQEFEF